MYSVIKNVLETGKFDLSDMIRKIETQWIQGEITEEQKIELIILAQTKADVKNSINPLEEIIKIKMEMKELKLYVSKLEQEIKLMKEENEDENEEIEEQIEEYIIGKWYFNGDKVIFESGIYVCENVPANLVCTWSPKEYPMYWRFIRKVD